MSVASDNIHSQASQSNASDLFSWIGIIMYLCVDDETGRADITDAFARYRGIVATELDDKCVVSCCVTLRRAVLLCVVPSRCVALCCVA